MVITKPTFLDSSSKFEKKQYEKINQMINAQFKRFISRATQKQLKEELPTKIAESYSGRCQNVVDYYYNDEAYISFIIDIQKTEQNIPVTIFTLKKEPTTAISIVGSNQRDGTGAIRNYGYIKAVGKDLQWVSYDDNTKSTESIYLYATIRFGV